MKDEPYSEFSDIDQNVATNLREVRERYELSQDELATRMSERGFGFTQATVWKIESGQRSVKVSEVAALGDALGLVSWTILTRTPERSRHLAQLQFANGRIHQGYAVLKKAAAEYIHHQIDLVFAVREAQDAGVEVPEMWTSWLDIPAEAAAIEARVEWSSQDDIYNQRDEKVDAILQALREHGYTPPRPEDLQYDPS